MKNKQFTILLTIFIISFIAIFQSTSFAEPIDDLATNISAVEEVPSAPANNDISTYSTHCVLMEASTGKVIYGENIHEKMYPASTTKIMTAILALEHCELTDVATVSHEAIYTVPVGYSHAYLVEGEELTIYQLLHLLLIPSANDAANVLAERVAGSIDSFVTMMNTKAVELGCENTHFVNTNGIHDANHYSTSYDLALMGRYAMQNDIFREIVAKTKYTLPSTNKYAEANRFFSTTNPLIIPDDRDSVDNYYYEYATGAKTGYTVPAGDCIVATAKKDDMEFIVVILGADKTENGLSARNIDCKNLFNYAFENYKTYTINEKDSVLKQISVSNAGFLNNNLDVIVKDEITLVIKNDTIISNITPEINISSDLAAPITKNSTVGTITYTVDGNTYTSDLIAGKNVAESNTFNSILTIASIILVIYLLYRLVNTSNKGKRERKKKSTHSYR